MSWTKDLNEWVESIESRLAVLEGGAAPAPETEPEPEPTPKKRGRPAKTEKSEPKRRGRPPKAEKSKPETTEEDKPMSLADFKRQLVAIAKTSESGNPITALKLFLSEEVGVSEAAEVDAADYDKVLNDAKVYISSLVDPESEI